MITQDLPLEFLTLFERISAQQIYLAASLLVITLVFSNSANFSSLVWPIQMVLENLGLGYAFKWLGGGAGKVDLGEENPSKGVVRTRAEQQLAVRNATGQDEGRVNLLSVLQKRRSQGARQRVNIIRV